MCEVCNTHVLNDSKHCGACNRCVNAFDHHCRWINNCVGQKNYILFFRLIMITFFMTSVHAFTIAFNIYFQMTNEERWITYSVNVFGKDLSKQFTIILFVACFFNLASMLFLGNLTTLHIHLQKLNMTTFDYIKWKERRTRRSKVIRLVAISSLESSEVRSNPLSSIEPPKSGEGNTSNTDTNSIKSFK